MELYANDGNGNNGVSAHLRNTWGTDSICVKGLLKFFILVFKRINYESSISF